MSLIIDQRTVTLEIANEFTCGKTPLNEVIENFYNTKVAKEIKNKEIVDALELPPIKIHCSVLAEDSIKQAIEDYESKQ